MSTPARARLLILAPALLLAACGGQGNDVAADQLGRAESGPATSTPTTADTGPTSVAGQPATTTTPTSAPAASAPASSAPDPTSSPAADLTLGPGEVGTFTSPSGNIACTVAAEVGASCYIGEKQWTIDEPDGCAGSDYGNAIEITADGAAYSCYTDFPWDPAAPPLPYGSTMSAGPYGCESATTGVTCRRDGGEGFRIARAAGEILAG